MSKPTPEQIAADLVEDLTKPMSLYVIYQDVKDYPGKFLIKRWNLTSATAEVDQVRARESQLVGVVDSLEEARKLIPAGLHNLGRSQQDDPVIVETWI
jgi:hypothetical protein